MTTDIDQEKADCARDFCINIIEGLQAEFRERAKVFFDQHPDARRPCPTCAMNPSTNGRDGQDVTALRFLSAMDLNEKFWCHHDAPFDPEQGWLIDTEGRYPNGEMAPLCAARVVLDEWPLSSTVKHRLIGDAMKDGYGGEYKMSTEEIGECFDGVVATLIAMVA